MFYDHFSARSLLAKLGFNKKTPISITYTIIWQMARFLATQN